MHIVTPEALDAAGYVSFHDTMAAEALGPYYRCSYQKWVRDDFGKCFAINIRYGVWPADFRLQPKAFFAPEVQFTRGQATFNMTLLHHAESVAEIEAFFREAWIAMRADYYETDAAGGRYPQPIKSHPSGG